MFYLFHKPDPILKMFSATLYMLGSKAFRYAQKALPLYSETTCSNTIAPGRNLYTKCLKDIRFMNFLLDRYYSKYLDQNTPIFATLGGDAAQLSSKEKDNNIYTYVFLITNTYY